MADMELRLSMSRRERFGLEVVIVKPFQRQAISVLSGYWRMTEILL